MALLSRCLVWFVFAGFLVNPSVFAQQPPTPQPPPPNPSPSPAPTPRSTPQPTEEMPRVLFLNGSVLMADGSPPPRDLDVELICSGRVVQKTNVSGNGHFSFDLGRNRQQVVADASMGGWESAWPNAGGSSGSSGLESLGVRSAGLGRVDLNACDVRIPPRPGYHSNQVHLRTRSVFDNPDIGTIVLQRLSADHGTVISVSSLKAPGKAKKSFRRAGKEMTRKQPRHERAIQHLEEAVAIYPGYAEAWNSLGQIRLMANDEAGARQAFQQAIQAEEKFLGPYVNLAQLEMNRSNWEAAAKVTAQLLDLSPYLPDSFYLDGVANYYLRDLQRAEESLREAQEKGEGRYFVRTHLFLGMVVAERGVFEEAAQYLRYYLKNENEAEVSDQLRGFLQTQLTKWEDDCLIEADTDRPSTP